MYIIILKLIRNLIHIKPQAVFNHDLVTVVTINLFVIVISFITIVKYHLLVSTLNEALILSEYYSPKEYGHLRVVYQQILVVADLEGSLPYLESFV